MFPSNGQNNAPKRGRGQTEGPLTLEEKVSILGGKTGYGLDQTNDDGSLKRPVNPSMKASNTKGLQKVDTENDLPRPNMKRFRSFPPRTSDRVIHRSSKSECGTETSRNPYKDKKHLGGESATRMTESKTKKYDAISHIVCSISENIARETCIVSMDASSPVTLSISKQCNGQSYAETIAYLQYLQPNEVLLNEGRKSSQLSQKITSLFQTYAPFQDRVDMSVLKKSTSHKETTDRRFSRSKKNSALQQHAFSNAHNEVDLSQAIQDDPACPMTYWENHSIIKFVPRTYFDQKKGAELLHRVARQGSYDPSILEEYIFLSSSYAVLQYMQSCLGAYFSTASIDLCLYSGQNNRMAIDRSSIIHLELLANARTGKLTHSLIGTIDCTKTSVGSRLLRNSLIAPPTRTATIDARLDLVGTFLRDEEFFYEVMAQLDSLPDLNKMMGHIALTPDVDSGSGGKKVITPRIASRGISALVCIKTTLTVIHDLARVLQIQLSSLNENRSAKHDDETDDCSSLSSMTHPMDGDIPTSVRESVRKSPYLSQQQNTLTIALGGQVSDDAVDYSSTRHQLLEAIICAITNPALNEILDFVTDIFTESTTYCKNSHAMRHQECFALKPNTDGIMDILRKAYLANVDDIYRFADEYAESFGTTVAVKETTARGYYLSIPNDLIPLPNIFIQPVKSGKFINCTTEDVYSLNTRAQENVQDLLLMTHERIQEVMNEARRRFEALASMSDAIALLDLCHSFADNVASSHLPWCRPFLTDFNNTSVTAPCEQNVSCGGGALIIKNGRFAIDVQANLPPKQGNSRNEVTGGFIPNDTYASAYQNFTVITGVNGSGKTFYLKQIAIIVILAHCGSYVPADEAFIPIRDKIFTRLGNSDDQEHNISSFLQEMKESAFICNNVTDRSLVLIDELGRATSNEDGVAIAWAIAEYLLLKRATTFFVTHYPQLCKLSEVYPNVQNQHLGILPTDDLRDISYTHKILPGPCTSSADYGIKMCAMCGWDQGVVFEAEMIRNEVGDKLPEGAICRSRAAHGSLQESERQAENILWSLAKNLASLKENFAAMTDHDIRQFLQDLRCKIVSDNNEDVLESMKALLQVESEDMLTRHGALDEN